MRPVVCILTGHELKDPNATVQYHTGIDMKTVQDLVARRVRMAGSCRISRSRWRTIWMRY